VTSTAIAARSDRIQRTLEHLRRLSTDTADRLVPFGPGQYADPGLAQRERDLVFGRVPSIVARQHDGSVKSFVNVRRHRGALTEAPACEPSHGRDFIYGR
jgi:hypothetical protein